MDLSLFRLELFLYCWYRIICLIIFAKLLRL